MTMECHNSLCPYHNDNSLHPDGSFCDEEGCQLSAEEYERDKEEYNFFDGE